MLDSKIFFMDFLWWARPVDRRRDAENIAISRSQDKRILMNIHQNVGRGGAKHPSP